MAQAVDQGPVDGEQTEGAGAPEQAARGGLLAHLRDRRTWTRVTFVAPAAGVLVVAAVIGVMTSQHRAEVARLAVLEEAKEACASGMFVPGVELEDDGRTLLVDTEGEDEASGATYSQLACVMDETGAPASAIAKMESTRALDGRQDAAWDDVEASWSYHPDTGLDLILTIS